ncbi:YncE family protein [Kibdelosporangium persicum]|uniref:DNA-binding beta-propeller fold protein YncE n=1 Tax=Kibdelosporangium persicum TaxID=2698649 RepID=A0ABX2F8D5_9PSEU|nr:YncE family protein [Kibdelosporangium persicum]NRN67186.1 DNA-binding beta-propeller fold protein YncE [Kibdelosporangium persicum]
MKDHAISRRTALKFAGMAGLPLPAMQQETAFGDVLAVVEKGDRRLAFFEAGTGKRLSEIVLGDYPHELVADRERRFAYIGHYGVEFSSVVGPGGSALWVVDLRARTLVRTIELAPFNRIHGVGMDSTNRLYALSEEKAVLLGFDASIGNGPSRAVNTGGIKTHMFAITRNGERAYVTGLLSHTVSLVRPYDAAAAPVMMTPGQLPESACLSTDEQTLFVGARRTPAVVAIDANTMSVRGQLKVAGDPLRVYTVSQDQLLVTDLANKAISLISTRLQPIWTMPVPGQPSAVSFHPSKPVAYVSLLDTQQVAVVDLSRRQITGTFPTLRQPDVSVLIPG